VAYRNVLTFSGFPSAQFELLVTAEFRLSFTHRHNELQTTSL